MKIGIIDSGIDINHQKLNLCMVNGESIVLCNDEFVIHENRNVRLLHSLMM